MPRTFADLLPRGYRPRLEIYAKDEYGRRIGLALKIDGDCTPEQLQKYLDEAAEALHRHIDEKEMRDANVG